MGSLAGDLAGDVQQIAGVEADLEGLFGIADLDLLDPLPGLHVAHRQGDAVQLEGQFHRTALLGRDGGDAVDGLGEQGVVDVGLFVVPLGNDAHVVGEGTVDDLGGQAGLAEFEADLLRADHDLDRAGAVVEQAADLVDGLARDDDSGTAGGALRGGRLGEGQSVAIGGDGPQQRDAGLGHGVEVEAVQIVAGLFGRDGEPGLVDQPGEVFLGQGEARARGVGRHDREVAGRQDRQVEFRTAGLDHQTGIVAVVAERDLGTVRQFADDFIEGVGGGGDLALDIHLGLGLVDHLHVEVGGGERQLVVPGAEQDVGQDRNGVAALDDALHVAKGLEERGSFDGQLHVVSPAVSDSQAAAKR